MPLATFTLPWVKVRDITPLSLGEVFVVRFAPAVGLTIHQRVQKPYVYEPSEDREYWNSRSGCELTGAEYLEIRSNLVGFIRALLAPGPRLQ